MEDKENYVTKLELVETQQKIETKLYKKINGVEQKVDTLNDIVLPLVESSKQTAKNTAKMASSLDDFTKEQRKTNGKFYDRLHDHELSINELGQKTKAQTEEKKANLVLIGTVATVLGGIIVAIFNAAPLLFN